MCQPGKIGAACMHNFEVFHGKSMWVSSGGYWTNCLPIFQYHQKHWSPVEYHGHIGQLSPHITVTSWWERWRLKSPTSRLFTQLFIQAQIKENIKAPRHWPLCGKFTGDRWISHTNGQQLGKMFRLMTSSWAQTYMSVVTSDKYERDSGVLTTTSAKSKFSATKSTNGALVTPHLNDNRTLLHRGPVITRFFAKTRNMHLCS